MRIANTTGTVGEVPRCRVILIGQITPSPPRPSSQGPRQPTAALFAKFLPTTRPCNAPARSSLAALPLANERLWLPYPSPQDENS